MDKFTKKQKKEYLKDPHHCPYCKSDNISAGELEADGFQAWSNVVCNNCKKEWTDIYTLTDVEELVIP